MEQTKGKISAFQFFVMLFLSRTLTTVTYLSSYAENIRLSDMLIQPIFRIIIGTTIMLPLYFLYRRHKGKNILEIVILFEIFNNILTRAILTNVKNK